MASERRLEVALSVSVDLDQPLGVPKPGTRRSRPAARPGSTCWTAFARSWTRDSDSCDCRPSSDPLEVTGGMALRQVDHPHDKRPGRSTPSRSSPPAARASPAIPFGPARGLHRDGFDEPPEAETTFPRAREPGRPPFSRIRKPGSPRFRNCRKSQLTFESCESRFPRQDDESKGMHDADHLQG